MIAKAVQISDPAKRDEMYREAERIFFRDQPLIIIGHSQIYSLMSQDLVDYYQSPFGFVQFYNVDLIPKAEQEPEHK